METKNKIILAIDIDNTITTGRFPVISGFKKGGKKYINKLYDQGYYIILWTCRYGVHADVAANLLKRKGYKFDQINEHHPEVVKFFGNDTRKLSYDILVDDKNLWVFGLPSWPVLYWMIKIKSLLMKHRFLDSVYKK